MLRKISALCFSSTSINNDIPLICKKCKVHNYPLQLICGSCKYFESANELEKKYNYF